MSIVTYNRRMMSPGIANLLRDVFSDDVLTPRFSKTAMPAVNIRQTDEAYELEMAVPGFDKKDININVEEDVLIISSEKENENKEEADQFTRKEFNYASFERSFNLPEEVDSEKIKAKHENGVLKVSIPKVEPKPTLKKMIKIA